MKLKCPGCKREIDDELIPLIRELNKIGLYTRYSCSGHDGDYAYIMIDAEVIKSIQYGFPAECSETKGKQCTIKWKIPKYVRKCIWCSDCGKKMKEVK